MELEKRQFSLRPTAEVHERLAQAAAWQGQTLHAFVLGAAANAADRVLMGRERLQLDPEDAEQIMAALDASVERNTALEGAFKKRAELLGE